MDRNGSELDLIAYHGSQGPQMRIVPAGRKRAWMSGRGQLANRCLPLVVANQAGWVLLNPYPFTATWDGGSNPASVVVQYEGGVTPEAAPVTSHFGLGIVTWSIPFVFRTPGGYNLLARGPANAPKDGIAPLEGLVEADWATATFTMNWKLTRPDTPVAFEVDEPFCMIVPQRRGELEAFRASLRSIRTNESLRQAAKRWAKSRHQEQVKKFLAEHGQGPEADLRSWEKHYFKGFTREGEPAPEHQSRLELAEFDSE